MESEDIYNQVNRRYGSIVKSSTGQYEQIVAKAFGYTEQELAGIPKDANLGLSCGNPTALAGLKEVCMFTREGKLFWLIGKGRDSHRSWVWRWPRCVYSSEEGWPYGQGYWN